MKHWDLRPFEVRNLFNPAFCGLLLHRAIEGFEQEDSKGIPFSLILLILPIALHKETRELMPISSRGYFLRTVEANPQILVGFADRTRRLLPFAFESLGLLMQLGCFEVVQGGRLKIIPKRVRKNLVGTDESMACQKVARILGREFARIGDRVTVYTTLGIRP